MVHVCDGHLCMNLIHIRMYGRYILIYIFICIYGSLGACAFLA
jgi:hypothetical protein